MCLPIPAVKSCENKAGNHIGHTVERNKHPWMDAQHPIFELCCPDYKVNSGSSREVWTDF